MSSVVSTPRMRFKHSGIAGKLRDSCLGKVSVLELSRVITVTWGLFEKGGQGVFDFLMKWPLKG